MSGARFVKTSLAYPCSVSRPALLKCDRWVGRFVPMPSRGGVASTSVSPGGALAAYMALLQLP